MNAAIIFPARKRGSVRNTVLLPEREKRHCPLSLPTRLRAILTALALLLCLGPHAGPAVAAETVKPAEPSLSDMAGQLILCGFRGTGDSPSEPDLAIMLEDIRQGKVGSVILFDRDLSTGAEDRNIVSLEQTRRLVRLLQEQTPGPRLFIGVDQEGGAVRRFREKHGAPPTPSPENMGRKTPRDTYEQALRIGRILHGAGVNLNFAPSLDVNLNPKNPVIGALGRSFSSDPEQVAAHGLAFAQGLIQAGVIPCFKHFPGHGSATGDTHKGTVDITGVWSEKELVPFRSVPGKLSYAMIMPGHMIHREKSGDLPATLSAEVISGMLRRDLGWRGVVITDDLQMRAIEERYGEKEAIRLAITAGADMLLFGNNLRYDAFQARRMHGLLLELVEEGAVPRERIVESYRRVLELKKAAGLAGQKISARKGNDLGAVSQYKRRPRKAEFFRPERNKLYGQKKTALRQAVIWKQHPAAWFYLFTGHAQRER